jgi:phosphate transport system permease protein
VWKQAGPGILSAVLLAFGRGIGDAASILFTAGFTDFIPRSLLDSAAALPTMIFFLSTSPMPEVRGRAYAAAFVLLVLVLVVSVVSRLLTKRLSRYVVK